MEIPVFFGNWIDLTEIRTQKHDTYWGEEHPDGTITLTPLAHVMARHPAEPEIGSGTAEN